MADPQLNHLLSVLYEAVLEPERWQEAVSLCGQYLGADDAQLFIAINQSLVSEYTVTAGTLFSLSECEEYALHLIPLDPGTPFVLSAHLHEWLRDHLLCSQQVIASNAFYQELLIPTGVGYRMACKLEHNEQMFSTIGVMRALGKPPFEMHNIAAGQRISGHLQRALRLQHHTEKLQHNSQLGARALEVMSFALWIVDVEGTIFHLNAQAEQLLKSRLGLHTKGGRLSCSVPEDHNQFEALLHAATHYPAKGGAMSLRGNSLQKLFVTPLPAVSRLNRDWQIPLALVLVLEDNQNLSSLQLMATLYDLSPTEIRIAAALLTGKSLDTYAIEAGVTLNTVRTQMKTLFNKTGTSRQAELVALLSQRPPLQL